MSFAANVTFLVTVQTFELFVCLFVCMFVYPSVPILKHNLKSYTNLQTDTGAGGIGYFFIILAGDLGYL